MNPFSIPPQLFETADLPVVAFLVLLEGLLSADNALVLAIMVRHLPHRLQKRALLYGLGGAFAFRLVAILFATLIIKLWWLQAIGAAYLIFLPIKHFRHSKKPKTEHHHSSKGFWQTVVAVEIADIAFAIDSVVAAVALISDRSKLWVVFAGAIIGIVLLRFAAQVFIKLLERFPALDHLAYALVGWVGVKLAFMTAHNFELWFNEGKTSGLMPGTPEMPPSVFWGVMVLIIATGVWFAVKKAPKRPKGPNLTEND